MTEINVISAEEFISLAEKRNRAYKYGKVLVYCDRCRHQDPTKGTCFACGGKGMSIVLLPILIQQKMPPEDFEFLKIALRLGEQYG